jgi:aminopeptidase N
MSAAVRHGSDATVVDTLIATYQTTSATDIQSDITSAVTSSKDPGVLQRLITMLTDTKIIRSQDTVRWYVNLLRNREGRSAAWQWLRDNWAWIETTFASDKSHDYFPRYSANILGTKRQLQEYKDFFAPLRENPSLTRAIDMGILDLEGRIALIERDTPAVIAELDKF